MFSKFDQDLILQKIGGSWLKLYQKKVFITGATGFIGKWLIGSLLLANRTYSLGCTITVLTRNSQVFRESNVQLGNSPEISFIDDDVRFFSYDNKNYDFVIHAATDIAQSNSSLHTFDVCTLGTRSVLDFAIKSNASNFILLSSGAVYGKQPVELNSIPEGYSGMPARLGNQSAYGLGKVSAEWMTSQYSLHYGLNIKIARCFSFIGPFLPMDKHFAIGNFIKDAISGRSITINGDGSPIRTYLYSADLAIWLWKIILDANDGDIFNVGGDREISIRELADLVGNLVNPRVKITTRMNPVEGALPERYVPDISSAKNKLGLHPTVSLESSIQKTSEWFRESLK